MSPAATSTTRCSRTPKRQLSAIDAAKIKWWCADVQNDVLDACVQLYGGYGYMNE